MFFSVVWTQLLGHLCYHGDSLGWTFYYATHVHVLHICIEIIVWWWISCADFAWVATAIYLYARFKNTTFPCMPSSPWGTLCRAACFTDKHIHTQKCKCWWAAPVLVSYLSHGCKHVFGNTNVIVDNFVGVVFSDQPVIACMSCVCKRPSSHKKDQLVVVQSCITLCWKQRDGAN